MLLCILMYKCLFKLTCSVSSEYISRSAFVRSCCYFVLTIYKKSPYYHNGYISDPTIVPYPK
jgi:putative component of membrane protein insertase Oxa1/YidC/SpoIIIJ protein YidD